MGTFAQKKAVSAVSPSHFYLKLSYDTNHLMGAGPPFPLPLLPRVLQRLKCIFRERDFSDT